jgi:phosphatidylinositol alpha-mannosyltransferase
VRSSLAAVTATGAVPASGRRQFRIAVVSYGLPTPGQKSGGVDQVAHDLANAWVDRGHAVTVFTYARRPARARYMTLPLPAPAFATTWLGMRVTMGYLGNVLVLLPRYRAFDVIVAHGDSLLLPLLGKPVLRVMHGSALEEARSATSLTRAVLQYGVFVQELITAKLLPTTVGVSENTRTSNPYVGHVIPNGIDRSMFRPDQSARTRRPSILCVGALGGRKRGSWLVDRFRSHILPACPGAELHMVMSAGRPEPGVHYHEGVDAADLVRLYQAAWVYASPSTYEGFGLPYLEAMACGTPVVATPNPGSVEVLDHGRYGRLTRDHEFASTILRLLNSPAERATMSAAGLQRATEFDVARSAERYESLIDTMVPARG